MTDYASNHRRYCLLKLHYWRDQDEDHMAAVYRAKQSAISGTALPAGFPSATALAAAWYEVQEDLDGADADELKKRAGLTTTQADAVIAAFEEL